MVAEAGQRNIDYPASKIWKNSEYEHGGEIFFCQLCGRSDLFEGLKIWENEEFRKLQGTYPVISVSFANVKERSYPEARRKICQILSDLYSAKRFLINTDLLDEKEKNFYALVSVDMDDLHATMAIHNLSRYLFCQYGKKQFGEMSRGK